MAVLFKHQYFTNTDGALTAQARIIRADVGSDVRASLDALLATTLTRADSESEVVSHLDYIIAELTAVRKNVSDLLQVEEE